MFVFQSHQVKVEVAEAKSVSVCPAWALTSECLGLQSLLLVCRYGYIFRISKLWLSIQVVGSKSYKRN